MRPHAYFCVSSKLSRYLLIGVNNRFVYTEDILPRHNSSARSRWLRSVRSSRSGDKSSERQCPLSVVLIDIEHSPSCMSPDRLLEAAQSNRQARGCRLSSTDGDSHPCFPIKFFEDRLCFFVVTFRYWDFLWFELVNQHFLGCNFLAHFFWRCPCRRRVRILYRAVLSHHCGQSIPNCYRFYRNHLQAVTELV